MSNPCSRHAMRVGGDGQLLRGLLNVHAKVVGCDRTRLERSAATSPDRSTESPSNSTATVACRLQVWLRCHTVLGTPPTCRTPARARARTACYGAACQPTSTRGLPQSHTANTPIMYANGAVFVCHDVALMDEASHSSLRAVSRLRRRREVREQVGKFGPISARDNTPSARIA